MGRVPTAPKCHILVALVRLGLPIASLDPHALDADGFVAPFIKASRKRREVKFIHALALTGTDPLSLMKADPADARLLVDERGGASSRNRSRRSVALASFFVWREGGFFASAYVSDRDARSVGQARSGATRSHA